MYSHYSKYTLPCFNHICTGYCPFGAKCKFIHDPRLAPSFNLRCPPDSFVAAAPDESSTVSGSTSSEDDYDEEDATATTKQYPGRNQKNGLYRDTIFNYPLVREPFSRSDTNQILYEFSYQHQENHHRELSMWRHMIAGIHPEDHLMQSLLQKMYIRQLPVFASLAKGESQETQSESAKSKVRTQLFRLKVAWLSLLQFSPEEKARRFQVDGDWNMVKIQKLSVHEIMDLADQQGKRFDPMFLQRAVLLDKPFFTKWSDFWAAYRYVEQTYGVF